MLPSCSLLSCSQLALADLRSLAWWSRTCSQELWHVTPQHKVQCQFHDTKPFWNQHQTLARTGVLELVQCDHGIRADTSAKMWCKAQAIITTHDVVQLQWKVEVLFRMHGMVYQTWSNSNCESQLIICNNYL